MSNDGNSIIPGTFTTRKWAMGMGCASLLFVAALAIAVLFGSTMPARKVLQPWTWTEDEASVVMEYRVPRALVAGSVGMALGVSGAALQAVLANPLVEPYLLGMASGGAFFVALGIVLGIGSVVSQGVLAFPGALLAGVLVLGAARAMGLRRTTGVILVGVMVNALFGALVQVVYYRSNVHEARDIVTWMLGVLPETAGMRTGLVALAVSGAGAVGLSGLARALNLMMLGEETAKASGVDADLVKRAVFVLVSILTAAAVSLAGPLGFVGLVVPHLTRLGMGVDNRMVLPGSALFGAAFVLVADTVSRCLISVNPLPVGVVTALTGCPVFLWLLWREGRRSAGA